MAMPPSRPAVFTIPAGVPFADRLVAGFLDRLKLDGAPASPAADLAMDPMALARATILVPTRRAVRAVARACATNPVALVVPCHRVVPTAGGAGGYRWGEKTKKTLLAREARAKSL